MKRGVGIIAAALLAAAAGWLWWPEDPVERAEQPPVPAAVEPPAPPAEPRRLAVTPAPELGRIAGGVHRHGVGIAGATVTARGERGTESVVTGEGGGFLFTLPADSYLLSATLAEEASEVVGPVELRPGETRRDLVLELLPSATLLGVVLNEQTRAPIPGARVSSAGQSRETDDRGRFELRPVSVGEAWLEVSAKGFISRTEWLTVDAARRLGGMEIALAPAAVVRGQVLRQGAPAPLARVWTETDSRALGMAQGNATQTDATGAFSLELPAGRAVLAAAAPGEARVEGPTVTVAAGQRVEGIVIELGQPLAATGFVTVDGEPGAGASLTLFDARSGRAAASAVADQRGRFEAPGLSPGPYLVQVRALGVDDQQGPFTLTGADDPPWQLPLRREGVVHGTVIPPTAGVRVRMRASDWVGGGASTSTDAHGRFVFEGVKEEVLLEAEGPAGHAEARARPGQETRLSLQHSLLRGSVTDERGGPLTDFSVRLRPLAGGAPRTHAVLSPTGRFRLRAAPGDYEVTAFAPGAAWAEPVRATAATGGGGSEAKLVLAGTAPVDGVVFDGQSLRRIAGAEVQVRIGGAFNAMVFATTATSASGEFRFQSVPLSAGVVATAAGYKPRYIGVGALNASRPSPGAPAAIMLEKGDPPEWLKSYEGIGLSWAGQLPQLSVRDVFAGSPAEAAGILPGDLLLSVDGRPATSLSFDQVISGIRGPAGSPVRLGFSRQGKPYQVVVRRRSISL